MLPNEGLNFLDVIQRAREHFKGENQLTLETASSNLDESMMNAYREVVPKAQFENLKHENARLKREIPKLKDSIDTVKIQTRNVENEVNFMMSGVEDVEEIKSSYDQKVKSYEADIELLKQKIE